VEAGSPAIFDSQLVLAMRGGTNLGSCPGVVIIGLNTPWDHWTVAHKVTPRAVAFFDSYGMRRYHFTSFTLDKAKAGDLPGQKIMIDVDQSFRLSRGE
jgi:hypothetical protein